MLARDGTQDALFGGRGWCAARLTAAQLPLLQALCMACADFFELTTGLPPGPAQAQSLYSALPENASRAAKCLCGIRDPQGRLIGALDTISNFPQPGILTLGLLLLLPERRHRGLGGAIVRELVRFSGAPLVRIGVLTRNAAALAFWRHLGFETVATRETCDLTDHPDTLQVMELRAQETGAPGSQR